MQYVMVIKAGQKQRHYWRDLWLFRELFWVLARRDLSVRYKQTVIGVLWAVIRPALSVLVFTIIFGRIAKLPSDGAAPYSLMVFAGLLPWTFFSTGLADASNSLVINANLVSKVYFPRMIVPAATIGVALTDFLISLCMFVALMLWYRFLPGWQVALLPLFLFLAILTTLGPSLWLSALNVKYRDFRYVIPFIVQFGLYVSPVGFTSNIVPERWRLLYSLNPMVGAIDGFRWCLLGQSNSVYLPGVIVSICVTVILLWLGISRFQKLETSLADLM
jgi:lipopolysaccharide transport system permease protein